jgi:translation initiation factor 2B subunit (eIF-2B alpha/beta/delta family)
MKMSKKADLKKKNVEYWRKEIEELRKDSTHGSMYLADTSLDIIERFIEKQIYNNRTELFQSFSKLVNALVRAKPLMAMIFTRSHRLLDFIENLPKDERDILKIKNLVMDEIQLIRSETAQKQKSIVKFGARLVMDQHTILTHSSSSMVEAILREAKRMRKHFKVICTESRPLFEGYELAKRLAKAGIKTKLVPDADFSRVAREANFILLGTDRVTETSFINKTGTLTVAVVAREFNTPFYIALDTAKILPKRTYPAKFLSDNEEEILPKTAANLTAENFYFEEIPLSYIHKIVCEAGVFETPEFTERFLKF